MRKLILAVLLSITMINPCYAMTAHEQAMSYILADQDKPTKAGDKFYTAENEPNPVLVETTAYYTGVKGSHGDVMKEGYCAAAPELYGDVVMLYEAIPQDDGTYRIGEYLDTLLVKDTGYGYPTNTGTSKVRPDKGSMGTLESAEKLLHIDVRKDSFSRCKEWMNLTKGKAFAVIVQGEG